jgi:thiol:disulfide interchange protein DsbC
MKRLFVLCSFVTIFVLGSVMSGLADPVEEALTKAFPSLNFDSLKPTPINGIYEVVTGTKIVYFVPQTDNLILGEIIDKNGNNITAARRDAIVIAKAASLPLDKAVKIGSGEISVIEFTDPDCPYCRKAAAFFQARPDVKRYVFFLPLPFHPDAERKVRYIFCSGDRAKTYEDAMKGKLDDGKYEVCKNADVDEMVKLHKKLAGMMGVTGTPFFIINGHIVVAGADIPRIEAALKQE